MTVNKIQFLHRYTGTITPTIAVCGLILIPLGPFHFVTWTISSEGFVWDCLLTCRTVLSEQSGACYSCRWRRYRMFPSQHHFEQCCGGHGTQSAWRWARRQLVGKLDDARGYNRWEVQTVVKQTSYFYAFNKIGPIASAGFAHCLIYLNSVSL